MATTTFSTWSDLLSHLKDSLASGEPTVGEVRKGTTTIRYRSIEELQQLIGWVQGKAMEETGKVVYRTYARQGGRGL